MTSTTRPIPLMKRELDLFEPPRMQNNYEGYTVERVTSINGGSDPLEFRLNGSGNDYMALRQHYLVLHVRLLSATGTALIAGDLTTPVNNFIHSLWNDIKVTMNGTVISPKEENYAYKAYMNNLLSFGPDALDTKGACGLFYKDTAGVMDAVDDTNEGATARQEHSAASRTFEVLAPLDIDLFAAGRVLPNGCDITVKLTRNKPEFSLMIPDGLGRKIDIKKAELVIIKPKLTPATALGHAASFERNVATYPFRRTEIQTAVVEAGIKSKTISNLCAGQLPRRVFIGLVSNLAYNGSRVHNPFNFEHFNLNYMALTLDGHLKPNIPLTPNFTDRHYLESYMSLFTATGKYNVDEAINITRQEYPNGYCIYGFDLSSDQSADAAYFDGVKTGNFVIDLKFSEATPRAINVVVLFEYDSVIRLDRSRKPQLDY